MSDDYLAGVLSLRSDVAEFFDELGLYAEKGATNASQARRLRARSMRLREQLKNFRAESLEHHRKG